MKNIRHIFSLVSAIAVLTVLTSCQDFLTIYPTDKVVLENYWKDKADVEGMVAGSYYKLCSRAVTDRMIVWGELRGDNVVEGTWGSGDTDLEYINEANMLQTNGYCTWGAFYSVINNCNIVMKFAPKVVKEDPDFTDGDLKVVTGEMLALRALCHFYLLRTFRDIPLLMEAKVEDDQELYGKQVAPLVAVDSILSDLYKAENLVLASGAYPEKSSYDYNKGRVTRDAVRAMIADVLLWKAAFTQFTNKSDGSECYPIYTECIEYCRTILADRRAYLVERNKKEHNGIYVKEDIGNNAIVAEYPLNVYPTKKITGNYTSEPYYKVFGRGNDVTESIFELQSDRNDSRIYGIAEFYGNPSKAKAPFVAAQTLGKVSTGVGSDNNLYQKTDERRCMYSVHNGSEEDVFPIAKYTTEYTSDATDDKNRVPTYFTEYNDDGQQTGNKGYYTDANWILYRISDVMLMEAEAYALRNDSLLCDEDSAFKLVKAIYYRSNPYKVLTSDSITVATEGGIEMAVLKERQRELCFEGKRWYDLVRKALRDGTTKNILDNCLANKYATNWNATKTKLSNINCLFFPIAERELNVDPDLVQNPEYVNNRSIEKN